MACLRFLYFLYFFSLFCIFCFFYQSYTFFCFFANAYAFLYFYQSLLLFMFFLRFLSYWFISCHTERSEVSTKSKCKFVPLKCGFFTLNLKCVLNSMDISLTLNMTSGVDFLAVVTPCNPPSRYAQNDKGVPSLRANFAKICVAIHEKI